MENPVLAGSEHLITLLEPENRQLLEALPAAVYTCDASGRITYFNRAAAALWGREPVLGKDLWCGSWKIFSTDDSPMDLSTCPMAIALKEGRAVEGEEIVIERPDGRRMNVLPFPKPIYDAKGKVAGAINLLVDISGRKEKERLLHEREKKYLFWSKTLEKKLGGKAMDFKQTQERYHKMTEEVIDYAILLLDEQGHILNWNLGAKKIKGYSEEEIIGKHFGVFYLDEDRNNGLPERLIEEAKIQGRAKHEGWRTRKDGSKFWGSVVITALHNDKNEIIGFSKVTRDLTEKKLAEDQLHTYARDIEFRNKQLEEFAHVASHDLQEPIRKIQTFANLLEKNLDDEQAVSAYLGKIHSSAQRMSLLIQEVLKYSTLSAASELFRPTDLNEVLAEVLDDFEVSFIEKQAKIEYGNLPKIQAIPVQIHQLFFNLISNSLKFAGDEPFIEITSETIKAKSAAQPLLIPNAEYLKIIYRDNGIGFEQEYAEKAFKMFHKLHSDYQGTGIGLAVCKKVIENHNGAISVSSKRNAGTRFDIYFPL